MNNAVSINPGIEAAPATAWRAYHGISPAAVDEKEVVERYLPLVRNVVDRLKINLPAHVAVEELYSIGVTGLMAAIRKFDPYKGDTFAGYATMKIRGAILDELRRMDWCPRQARSRARKIKLAIATLEQRTGRCPTDAEIRAHLGLTAAEYDKWVDDARPVTFVAIDDCLSGADGQGPTLHEMLPDENDVTGRETTEKSEMLEVLSDVIRALPPTAQKVLAMYYFEEMRLAEIAHVLNLTESRICQIHAQAILLLRGHMQHLRSR